MTEVDPNGRMAQLKQLLDSKGVEYHDQELQPLLDGGWEYESRLAIATAEELVAGRVPPGLAKVLVQAFAAGGSGAGVGTAVAGGAGASRGTEAENTAMTAFLNNLREAKNEASFLELSAAYFPDDETLNRQILFVRDSYQQLYDAAKSRAGLRSHTLVTGTPGIGKSWWIWYAMWRLLKESESSTPPAIVWETHQQSKRRVLFNNGKALVGSRKSFESELSKRSTWYFADGLLPHPAAACTIMVCSPKREVYKDFLKRGAAMLVLPVWSKDELDMCHKRLYPALDKGRMDGLYNKYGGVPRNVLEYPSINPEDLDLQELHQALGSCDTAQVLASLRMEGAPETSHRLLHLEPNANLYLESITVASRYVAEGIMRRACQDSEDKMRSLLGALAGDPTWSSFRGSLFEQLAHTTLCKGGKFALRALHDASASNISTPGVVMDANLNSGCLTLEACERRSFAASGLESQVEEWSNSKPAAHLYLVPESATYPGIDALVLPPYLFQMTIQQHRKFDLAKTSVSLDFLPDVKEYCFFYVIPSWLKNFKADIREASDANAPDRAQRLRFFALTIDTEDFKPAIGSKRPSSPTAEYS